MPSLHSNAPRERKTERNRGDGDGTDNDKTKCKREKLGWLVPPLLPLSVPPSQQQQQPRSARIDLIMKLFPEQNGNLMNPLHTSSSSLQSTTLQQAAAIIPTLTNQVNSLDTVSNLNPSSALNSSLTTVNNSSNYPLEMECDPVSNASLTSSSSLNTANPNPNPSLLNSRYNFLLSGLSTSASSDALFNNIGITTLNTLGGVRSMFSGNGGSGGGGNGGSGSGSGSSSATAHSLSGNHAHLHRNSKSASNVAHSFAPTSLPIGLYSRMSNNSGGVVNNDTHSLAAYTHHLLGSGVGPNGNITYIPYSMSSETVPKNSSTMTSSSSLSSS